MISVLTVDVKYWRQAQALLVHSPIRLVVLQLAEKRVSVAQRFHYFFHHVEFRHRSLEKLGIASNILLAVSCRYI